MPEFTLKDVPANKALVYVYNPRRWTGKVNAYVCHARCLTHREEPYASADLLVIDPLRVSVPEEWQPSWVHSFPAARIYDLQALEKGEPYNVTDFARERVTGGMRPTSTTMVITPHIGQLSGPPYVFRTADHKTLVSDRAIAVEDPEILELAVTVVPKSLQWQGYILLQMDPGPRHFFIARKIGVPPGQKILPRADDLSRMSTINLEPGENYFLKLRGDPYRLEEIHEHFALTPGRRFQLTTRGILNSHPIMDETQSAISEEPIESDMEQKWKESIPNGTDLSPI